MDSNGQGPTGTDREMQRNPETGTDICGQGRTGKQSGKLEKGWTETDMNGQGRTGTGTDRGGPRNKAEN